MMSPRNRRHSPSGLGGGPVLARRRCDRGAVE